MNASKGEEAYGAYANMELFYGRTPWYYNGDRQNGEFWVDMNETNTRWIEGGAYVGYYGLNNTGSPFYSETTPNYFYARSYGPNTYSEFDYPGIGPAYGAWYGLYIAQQGVANGNWCVQWAWDKSPDACYNDFPKKSEQLQTGLEYATTQGTGAEINGRSVGWTEWNNWTWHEGWYGAYSKAHVEYTGSPLCIVAPATGYTYGSVAFSDPGC
jgi:hypothetical protein